MGDDRQTAAAVGGLASYLSQLQTQLSELTARVEALETEKNLAAAQPLMTIADIAAETRISKRTVERAIDTGELAVYTYVGRSPRLTREAYHDWLIDKK
jgi:excisionase family DNA binding protein